ncbi:uncharacterized protein LOC117300702 isoform X1 [Asterias rubens]|uniref:uncharacterized protein LOC117300702 isoform X1 n=1 Tax=Asterias rubens TaxID=7604 RepID=UPI0014550A1D|nr:uncharacterized protein LOC117300702 isoform X1 [Asterias rubens]
MAAMKWCQVACIAVLFAAAHVTCSPMRMMEEGMDNEISIRFDSVTLEQWEMAQADTNIIANDEFPKIIAESATSYCQGSMGSESLCKIGTSGTASNAFTESDVMIQTGYPKNENLDVQVVFYLSIVDQPKPEDENQYALQRSVLEAILKESQSNISSAVGYEVVFIGDERVGSPLDGTMNMVMIPLTIAVLVFLILITCCLNCRENRNDKAAGFASGKKRAEIPVEDAHGEGVVLTALNKGSSGVAPQQQTNNKTAHDKGHPLPFATETAI